VIGFPAVPAARLIGVTVWRPVTYAVLPSGVIAMAPAPPLIWMGFRALSVAVLMGTTTWT
jgi:hypothetical protein